MPRLPHPLALLASVLFPIPFWAQTTVFSFEGPKAINFYGRAVAGLGDVDRDGFDDFAIGDPGRVELHSGATGRVVGTIQSSLPLELGIGGRLVRVADMDGDGATELLVAATPTFISLIPSRVHVIRGAWLRWAFSDRHAAEPAQILQTFTGPSSTNFGFAIAGLEDVDLDGVPDVAISAFTLRRVTVYSGASGEVIYSILGPNKAELFGVSLSSAGDFDLDGRGDILVGAPAPFNEAGSAYVVSGLDGSILHRFEGDGLVGAFIAVEGFGASVTLLDDVDGGGRRDVLVGAFETLLGPGKVHAFSAETGLTLFSISGPGSQISEWSQFGSTSTNIGDVDGDGLRDILVATSQGAIGSIACVAAFSSADGSPLFELGGPKESLNALIESVADAGDVDGDGVPDILFGSFGRDSLFGNARVVSSADLALAAYQHEISLSAGGEQLLALSAGRRHAGRFYMMLSFTPEGGTLGSESVLFALATWLIGGTGLLDQDGRARSLLHLPSGAQPSMAGLYLRHQFVVLSRGGDIEMVSNTVPLTLVN